jgi:glutaredoxin 3
MTVIVYSTLYCPWCNRVKDFLKKHKIKFEDVDVSKDREKAEEMIEKSGQMGVPVIDIDGEITVGFNREKIKKLLKIKE